jgi:hypothetical protein
MIDTLSHHMAIVAPPSAGVFAVSCRVKPLDKAVEMIDVSDHGVLPRKNDAN